MTVKTSSALREPIVWLMFGIPLLTVVAGLYTVHVAGRANATDVVNIPVSRMAQVQQSDLSADETAARAGLAANLTIADGRWVISSKSALGNEALTLDLQHPIDKSRDLRLSLRKQGDRFISNAVVDKGNDWLLQLSDSKSTWRLVGRLHRQADSAELRASVRLP